MTLDIEALYGRYGPMVYRRCRRLLRDEARATDATHDVFVQLLDKPNALSRTIEPGAYLNRMATNLCLNRLRSEKVRGSQGEEALLESLAHVEDLEGRTLAGRVLQQLFNREPVSTRTMAVMHLLDDMTLEEVAREVGLSVSGVRKRLRKLQASLHGLEGKAPRP